ncbi:MAG: 23S rRNA (guanosine(2251)-2'-O)-methyltransferase RlmB [Pseudomonadota bacterium]
MSRDGEAQWVGGLHSARSVLRHGAEQIEEAWVDAGRRDRRLRALVADLRRAGVPIRETDRETLDRRLPATNHQGIILRARAPAALNETHLDELLQTLDEPPFLLVLDGVQDPHNLGACLRTADAAGVHAVIAPRDRSCGLTPTVAKVASGAAGHIPFIQVTNLARTLVHLGKAFGIWVIGTAGESGGPLYDADLRGPLALVMGAEGEGLRRLTRERCDLLVSIPMWGEVESLNVSVATGICLFEARRQRQSS